MKLIELKLEAALLSARKVVCEQLNESISEYLGVVLAKLKNKKPEVLFDPTAPEIDLDHLAKIMGGLKVLFNPTYRQAITRDEIDINPNNPSDLFTALNGIDKLGKDPDNIKKIFDKLAKIARDSITKQRATLDDLKSEDKAEREAAMKEVEKFNIKVGQLFNKVKTMASQGKQTAAQASQQISA